MQYIYRKNEQHLIENYEAAAKEGFAGWVLHHRLELTLDGHNAASCADLKRMKMYWRRPYFELIYLRRADHIAMHNRANSLDGKYCSQQRRDNISKAVRLAFKEGRIDVSGERNGMFGKHSWNSGIKTGPLSEETKLKLKGRTPWNKGKKCGPLSEEHKKKIREGNRKPKSEHMRKALREHWKNRPTTKDNHTWFVGVGPDGEKIYVKKE
jgi:hypothetical protein